jgi:indoleamine 2,3-dioxygenase
MLKIEDFDVTPERGFLTPYDMDRVTLPPVFDPVVAMGARLSDLITAGTVHKILAQLPEIDMKAELPKLSDAQMRKLMVHYSFIIQTYVWGEKEVGDVLPRNLAVPYAELAAAIGQFPLLPYSSYTLDNWGRLDPDGPISLENIYVIQNFIDGQDENWFIMVHVEIEAKAGAALAAMPALIAAADARDVEKTAEGLKAVLSAWENINPVFDRMIEKCDPYIYYNRVRPYIHGWKGNPALPDGVLYEGVFGNARQSFRGQTGSQSSIVPTMDALLGIAHENDPLREYLDELHAYRPPKHRRLIEAVAEKSRLRAFVIDSGEAKLITLYNKIVDHVQKFRTRHLEYAAHYINKQAQSDDGNPVEVGTGGTPFMKYLKKHRDESRAHYIGEYEPMFHAPVFKTGS